MQANLTRTRVPSGNSPVGDRTNADLQGPILLRVPEVANLIAMGVTKTWELINSGEIESVTIGRSRRVSVEALNKWLRDKESQR
jgi:excisionase family DNA binding protein